MSDDRTSKTVRDLMKIDIDHGSGRVDVERAQSRRFNALSPREREVAGLVATGRTNREIAEAMFISLATVKDHVHAILVKTGLRNRTAVVTAWHRTSNEPGSAAPTG